MVLCLTARAHLQGLDVSRDGEIRQLHPGLRCAPLAVSAWSLQAAAYICGMLACVAACLLLTRLTAGCVQVFSFGVILCVPVAAAAGAAVAAAATAYTACMQLHQRATDVVLSSSCGQALGRRHAQCWIAGGSLSLRSVLYVAGTGPSGAFVVQRYLSCPAIRRVELSVPCVCRVPEECSAEVEQLVYWCQVSTPNAAPCSCAAMLSCLLAIHAELLCFP